MAPGGTLVIKTWAYKGWGYKRTKYKPAAGEVGR